MIRTYGHVVWSAVLLMLFLHAIQPRLTAAQEAPPKREFRGAWIATVVNLDWPKGPTIPAIQQDQLVSLLDQLRAAGINAVFFQVRTEGDALYASDLEPWSYWLTGAQGTPPDPFYDPLAFAVEEAHRRGMELHAWFNPFRAVRDTTAYAVSPEHVTEEHPAWVLRFGTLKVLDPGLPEVRDYVTEVVMDVVRRYDVDGVHFDDYFYPYPPNEITNQDDATFATHDRGFTDRGDWRRDNINLFVAQVYDSLQAVRPEVKFGISPFGIWKSGVPPGIVGLDAYSTIYADATAWLDAGTIDYLAPQLYWAFGGGQDFGTLVDWWAEQANGRHLYAGHGLYKADGRTYSGTLYDASEVPDQIRYTRTNPNVQGSVFFRTYNLTVYNSQGIADTLAADLYRYPALLPVMPWKDAVAPGAPVGLAHTWVSDTEVELAWETPAEAADGDVPVRYALYRIGSSTEPALPEALDTPAHLLAVVGDTTAYTDAPPPSPDPYYYVVTGLDRNYNESGPSNVEMVMSQATDVEPPAAVASFRLHQNYPNPFNPSTEIAFTLEAPARVTLRVYNVLGQVVATLAEGGLREAGTHAVRWDGRDRQGRPVASGTYLYTLEAGTHRASKTMVLLK